MRLIFKELRKFDDGLIIHTDSVDHLIGFGAILKVDANDVRWVLRQTA